MKIDFENLFQNPHQVSKNTKIWWKHRIGYFHRLDGPAFINEETGECAWFIEDKDVTIAVNNWMILNNVSWPWNREMQILFQLTFDNT